MALANIFGWSKKESKQQSTACGTACGAADKEETKATCGTACGATGKQSKLQCDGIYGVTWSALPLYF